MVQIQQLAFSIVAIVHFAGAVPWRGALETLPPRADGLRHDEPALATITSVADLQVREFQPDDALPVNICGWVGGNVKLAAVCSQHSSCVWQTDYGIVGCCAESPSTNCAIYTSCVDIHSPKPSADRTDVYTCRGTLECYKNTYPGGYEQYGCGKSSWANTVLTKYKGMPKDKTLQIVLTGEDHSSTTDTESSETTSPSEPVTTETESETMTAESKTMSTASTATTTERSTTGQPMSGAVSGTVETSVAPSSNHSENTSHKTPVAAIAGGTVGGIAGLALIVAAVMFFMRKRRAKHSSYDITPYDEPTMAELESPKPPQQFGTPSTMHSPNEFSRPNSKVVPSPMQPSGPVELP